MARVILTAPGEDIITGGTNTVIGTSTADEIISIVSGSIDLDASFNLGGDIIVLPGAAASYTVSLVGSRAIIASGDTTVSAPVGPAGMSIQFADTTLELQMDTVAGTALLGGQTVTSTAQVVDPSYTPSLNTVFEAGTSDDPTAVAEVDRSLLVSSSGNANLVFPDAPSVLLQGTINTDEEDDWFSIYLEADESLFLDIEQSYDPNDPFEADSWLTIIDAEGNHIEGYGEPGFPDDPLTATGQDSYFWFDPEVSGTYFVLLSVLDAPVAVPQTYHVLLTVLEG